MHELDVIELVRPVDGYPVGTRAAVVSTAADGSALAEIADADARDASDDFSFVAVLPADARVVVAA